MDIAKAIPGLESWATEERNDFLIVQPKFTEAIKINLFIANPSELYIDTTKRSPIDKTLPVRPCIPNKRVRESNY